MKIGRSAKFIITIGVLSLFADMTYEAARSIHGPYLNVLGASGTVVGIIAFSLLFSFRNKIRGSNP